MVDGTGSTDPESDQVSRLNPQFAGSGEEHIHHEDAISQFQNIENFIQPMTPLPSSNHCSEHTLKWQG